MFTKDKDLAPLTTFGVPATADLYAEYSSAKELLRISRTPEFIDNEVLHMGGGSNLLFAGRFKGLVLRSAIKGITRYDKDKDTVYAIVGAGEKWTDFVDWCIEQGLGGVENMAGIPGDVGAAPVQNVGAYGSEAADVIHNVECFDTVSRKTVTFKAGECGFGYRDSRFKHEWKRRYVVLRVSFRLTPVAAYVPNLTYGPLRELEKELGQEPTLRQIADKVLATRAAKLPDPELIGSAGSFFKNLEVSKYFYEQQILGIDPDVPSYPIPGHDDMVKIPSGWLIDHAGLKGCRVGGAVVWPDQALVIANTGGATADDVMELADKVVETVRTKTGLTLHPEVNIIDTSIKVTILGSGTSKGVPEVGCTCRVCRSTDPKDKRLRASALVQTHGMNILIDASPDFRQQALEHNIYDLDAALITHSHYDHVGGMDDLRPFCAGHNFKLYMKEDVNGDLHRRLDYCFRPNPYPGVPTFDIEKVDDRPFFINGLKIMPIKVMHGKLPILGYRIGDFAYVTDAKTIEENEKEKLLGLDVLVINGLRWRGHFAHMSIDEALALIDELKPKEAYLTHFNHEVGMHSELERKLPPHVHPCHDGLVIDA